MRNAKAFERMRSVTFAAGAVALLLAGCSVPNWVNPVRWYDLVTDQFSSDPAPHAQQSAPPLSSVPERPRATPLEDRRQVTQGLVADREGARYTDDIVRRAETDSPTPPSVRTAPAPTQVARAEPPPRALPPPVAVAAPAPVPPASSASPASNAAPPRAAESSSTGPTLAERRTQPDTRLAQAADPLAERRITPGPAPTPAAPPRADSLDDRRATPIAPPASPAADDDTLDSRRTITSGRVGRTTPPPVAPPANVVVKPMAPPARPPTVAAAPPPPAAFPPAAAAPAPSVPRAAAAPLPAPAPAPASVVGTAPAFVPPRPTVAVAPGDTVLSQTFAKMLSESASTVTTAPAHISFAGPTAARLGPADTTAPAIVRDTFNASLRGGEEVARRGVQPAQTGPSAGGMSPNAAVIRFANGASKVEANYAPALRDIADTFKQRGGRLRVIGYASSRAKGSEVDQRLINFRLAHDRAQAVASELIGQGVPVQAIFIESRGEDPRFRAGTPEAEAESRRAEVFLDIGA
ncbi:MAG: OmpA family protein [Alphaproteobacteria bacterium]|nr:OmpA family protein [Alphaproteobacteria bacterium]